MSEPMSDRVRVRNEGDVACVQMDDGKANALSHEMLADLHAALDRVAEARALVISGRAGRFSGGFDLSAMMKGPDSARALVTSGAELMLRLYLFPRPVVVACGGHALAAGAILLLCADYRLGARGAFKIGFNEVAINLTPPLLLVELARQRLSRSHFSRAVSQAEIWDADGAREAGFLDHVVAADELDAVALSEARRLSVLPHPTFGAAKQRERGATAKYIRETLGSDMESLGVAKT